MDNTNEHGIVYRVIWMTLPKWTVPVLMLVMSTLCCGSVWLQWR